MCTSKGFIRITRAIKLIEGLPKWRTLGFIFGVAVTYRADASKPVH